MLKTRSCNLLTVASRSSPRAAMATKTKVGPKSTKCGCGVARGPRDSRKGSLPNVAMYAVRASGQRSASPSDRTYHAYDLGSGMGLTWWQWVEVKIKLLVGPGTWSSRAAGKPGKGTWNWNLDLEGCGCHWQWKQGRRQPLEGLPGSSARLVAGSTLGLARAPAA